MPNRRAFFSDEIMAGIKTIRDNLTGTFSKIIVGAIAVTFAMFFGWGTMFSNSDVNIIASVNGEKIDLYDLDLEMARVQSILAQRFEDPDFTVEEETLKSLALNSLITDALILDFLKQNQIEVLDLTCLIIIYPSSSTIPCQDTIRKCYNIQYIIPTIAIEICCTTKFQFSTISCQDTICQGDYI